MGKLSNRCDKIYIIINHLFAGLPAFLLACVTVNCASYYDKQ